MLIRLALLCVSLGVVATAQAQTMLQVSLDKAAIYWEPYQDPPPDGKSLPRKFGINCGGADFYVDYPTSSFPIRIFATAPGTYNTCVLWAENNFGRSAMVPVPAFEAGYIPADPSNVRIEVR
jgi:hypothetical protein